MVTISCEDIQVVQALLDHINSIDWLPARVELEYLEEQPPGMMLQQLSGMAKYNEDILGNYTAHFPFALYVRTWGSNSSDRINAIKVLNDLGAYFDEQTQAGNLPDLGEGKVITSITMTGLPSIFSRNEDGTENYQAIYRLEYEQNYD